MNGKEAKLKPAARERNVLSYVATTSQLNAPTVKFNPESTRKDNLGKMWVGLNSSNSTLLSSLFSVVHHPLNFNGKIFFLKCSMFL
jgi:hypothetical protein